MTDKPEVIGSRVGRFFISRCLLFDPLFRPGLLAVFGRVVPLRVDMHFHRDKVEYHGLSDLFDPLPPGEDPPEYSMEVTDLPGGGHSVRAVRVGEVVRFRAKGEKTSEAGT